MLGAPCSRGASSIPVNPERESAIARATDEFDVPKSIAHDRLAPVAPRRALTCSTLMPFCVSLRGRLPVLRAACASRRAAAHSQYAWLPAPAHASAPALASADTCAHSLHALQRSCAVAQDERRLIRRLVRDCPA